MKEEDLKYKYTRPEIGNSIIVNLGTAGQFSGIVVDKKYTTGKVLYDIEVFPFQDEPKSQTLKTKFENVDSYFIEFWEDRFSGKSNIGIKHKL